jgi:hypothetical protein
LESNEYRRAELCALRRTRDLDLERGVLRVSASVVKIEAARCGRRSKTGQ